MRPSKGFLALLLCFPTAATLSLLRWCAVSDQELAKCSDMSKAFSRANISPELACVNGGSVIDCVSRINAASVLTRKFSFCLQRNLADAATVDGGILYQAGKEHGLKPVVAEAYGKDLGTSYYAVAVVKASSSLTINHLRGAKTCHTGINRTAGWNIPVGFLLDSGRMPMMGCSVTQAVSDYFNASCVPGATAVGDPASLCELCIGDSAGQSKCEMSSKEGYYDYLGAFRCLADGPGEVAFVKHTTVTEAMDGQAQPSWTLEDFQLLCQDGSRAAVSEWRTCHLARVPAHAVITRQDVEGSLIFKVLDQGQQIQQVVVSVLKWFLCHSCAFHSCRAARHPWAEQGPHARAVAAQGWQKGDAAKWAGPINGTTQGHDEGGRLSLEVALKPLLAAAQEATAWLLLGGSLFSRVQPLASRAQPKILVTQNFNGGNSSFQMFDSAVYGGKNLLFKDSTVELVPIMEQTYQAWLGDEYLRAMRGLDCDPKTALLKKRDIDAVVLAGKDVYVAGKTYGLVPAAAEHYAEGDTVSTYYAVAVVKRAMSDAFTIHELQQKRSCHTGYGRMAGWNIPIGLLLRKGFIQPQECDLLKAVSGFFSASCIPTAEKEGYPANLCELCTGDSQGNFRCNASSQETYYGYTGAFRCLAEGHGDVAFVKHSSVFENTDGHNTDAWASRLRSGDFQLLCPNGARAEVPQFAHCHWGQVPPRAIMVHPDTSALVVYGLLHKAQEGSSLARKEGLDRVPSSPWQRMTLGCQKKTLGFNFQDFFGDDNNPNGFKMFSSSEFQKQDLIFKDSTVEIVPVGERRTFESWLGQPFLDSLEGLESSQCSRAEYKEQVPMEKRRQTSTDDLSANTALAIPVAPPKTKRLEMLPLRP
ncbi:hypothetical protein Chor_012831 [Crotalus horridus]